MYIPGHFREEDRERVEALISSHPFGTLVSNQAGQPFASHLPLLFEAKAGAQGMVTGHMARANPQWQDLADGQTVLVMFQGPSAYVSPAWYGMSGVPTWNYAAVHCYGRARLVEDECALEDILVRQTAAQEARYPTPWQADLSGDRRNRLLGMIIGFEIEISEIQAKFKLSQNRPADDQQRVAEQLAQSESAQDQAIAALMKASIGERT